MLFVFPSSSLDATVTDVYWQTSVPLQEVRAPFPGEVLYVVGTPPISAGEPVAFVGQPKP